MPNNNQRELFGVDEYGIHRCAKCNSMGTIVEMKLCCLIAAMAAADLARTTHQPDQKED